MINNYGIKPWDINFKAFFIVLISLLSGFGTAAQNSLSKDFSAENISTVKIDGSEIFNITVESSISSRISLTSILDGEYQNQYQIVTQRNTDTLNISLKIIPFTTQTDDKRHAHKVIAATLHVELPDNLDLKIGSDVGSAIINGKFKRLSVALLQGNCFFEGKASTALINTIDGTIKVITKNANVHAISKNGIVNIDTNKPTGDSWRLESINGNISVHNQE
ncbi:MAG: hypothetical protein HKN40_02850 [Winogradskyella sp.]|uniref:hypothetical protein n=1 Tax=Winogradskyella sp. TaxID=1883156 RepID=UPI0017D2407E|nr:hypothetical protein [Winogradskyella sp.]